MKNGLKSCLALFLVAIMLVSAVPLTSFAAQSDLSVSQAYVSPDGGAKEYNEIVTFVVKTSKEATRVKITYGDGSTYLAADIEKGFTDYSDSGSVRTFNVKDRVEIMGVTEYYAYAGNSEYGYSSAKKQVSGLESVEQDIKVTGVNVSKTSVSVAVGKTESVTASVTPSNASNKFLSWSTSNSKVATVVNGVITGVSAGTAVVTVASVENEKIYKTINVTVTADGGSSGEKNDPPYPFWKDYINYSAANTYVYYYGKIYYNSWYANAGVKPGTDPVWILVGDAEWTVPEDESNYTKTEGDSSTEIDRVLTDAEIDSLWGGIKEEYSVESALGRLDELIPKSYYEELFPYRFGSEQWKNCDATKAYYPDPYSLPDYYSYENLQSALSQLANVIIKVEWYQGAAWCYRLTRLDKTTKEQRLVYSDKEFEQDYLVSKYQLRTVICDYGSFLAVGSLNDRKRELAGFLANISHETGGGKVDGTIDELYSGLYFNEEVGFIGSSAIGYVQSTGTQYLPVAGKSYHGRGPIQLSYNYNYGLCSDVIYGDSSILLNNPEKVCQDGVLGLMTGIWFWMTPQPPKPSCHQVITGIWDPVEGENNVAYNGNFGLTIVIINNESGQSESGTGAVSRRARYYRAFCSKMGADISGEQCDTMGMVSFST